MNPIPYGKQALEDDDIAAVVETLKSSYLTQGPKINEFEKAFAAYVGAQFAIAISNGTTALHLAYEALGVKKGDIVLTTPNSFVATSNGVLYCGGEVSFVDIDPSTYNMSLQHLEEIIINHPHKERIKGVAAVDFGGLPLDWKKLKTICKRHDLWLLEDACHAVGAEIQNENGEWLRTGSGRFADIAVFSFHPVKHIACGEGGMITTNNNKLNEHIGLMRTHGITRNRELFKNKNFPEWYYEMQGLGFNYRLTDIQCALGLSQLKKIQANIERRREIAKNYHSAFKNLVPFQLEAPDVKNSYHLFVIRTPKRDELYHFLRQENIHTQVHYIPIHQQPYYQDRYGKILLKEADSYFEECLSLPMFHSLTEKEQDFVISKVKSFYAF